MISHCRGPRPRGKVGGSYFLDPTSQTGTSFSR
jgi:hypothetical protein